MSAAHGGQVLLSHSTAELVREHLPGDVSLRDMGEHKLKGLLQSENLWQVVAPDLKQDFPPLQTLDAMPNNLPGSSTVSSDARTNCAEVKQRAGAKRAC